MVRFEAIVVAGNRSAEVGLLENLPEPESFAPITLEVYRLTTAQPKETQP